MNALQNRVVFKTTITAPTFQVLTNVLVLMDLWQTQGRESALVCNRIKLTSQLLFYMYRDIKN
jgi:hypothetical protein